MSTSDGFAQFYSRRRQQLGLPYNDTEFLYPNNEPWPEQSFDYPYGQAPTVSNIPPAEAEDWQKNVGQYYTDNAVGTLTHPTPFGIKAADFARRSFAANGLTGYGDVSDELFVELLCEGLYSKYLGPLDPQDYALFGLQEQPGFEYLKSDQSCMRVVTKPWDGEYVAPAIAVFRRPANFQPSFDGWKQYEVVAIALARKDATTGQFSWAKDLVFDKATHSGGTGWWLAKYFVLQGAIHRINLVDHIKVHFPGDAINAITKSVLPRWHLISQLLVPHFRLTLPVNNTVLEGQRSIINRDTWYPWSPVTARGDEIRKLIPLAWAGGDYYWDERNTSYPRYFWSNDPGSVPDPADPQGKSLKTFIGLNASLYGKFLRDYHAPVLAFARAVVGLLPKPAATPEQDGIEWLELQRWAHEISELVPGFPDEHAIRDPELLAQVCATLIWNAAIVHSSDHATLHMMIDKHPVPFILRVNPPASNSAAGAVSVQDHVDANTRDQHQQYVGGAIRGLESLIQKTLEQKFGHLLGDLASKGLDTIANDIVNAFDSHLVEHGSVPLCWPTDLVYCKMADLLFYRPHNTSLLYDCGYDFLLDESQMSGAARDLYEGWKKLGRPVVDGAQRGRLLDARKAFQASLAQVNALYYDATGKPVDGEPTKADDIACVMNRYGFPKLVPGTQDTDVDGTRMECCFGAGIQY
jgi:hypothetical protein